VLDQDFLEADQLFKNAFTAEGEAAAIALEARIAASEPFQNMDENTRGATARRIAQLCVARALASFALGKVFGSTSDGLINKPGQVAKHPCGALDIYMPSEADLGVAARHRATAIGSYAPWVYQERFKPPYVNAWIHTRAGCAGMEDGQNCDEFPNAAMVDGGNPNSSKRPSDRPQPKEPSLLLMDADPNQKEGRKLASFYGNANGCGNATPGPDGLRFAVRRGFLVLPVVQPAGINVLLPPTTAFCADSRVEFPQG